MKKLMIAAAFAAIGTGVYAASSAKLEAQAYDVTLTVKTTTCREVKITRAIATLEGISSSNWNDVKKDKVVVRKQASRKIAGVIWGCDCDAIAYPAWRLYPQNDAGTSATVGGYLFWPVGGETPFDIRTTAFAWAALGRIDNGEKVEGVWALVNDDKEAAVALLGAGFGKSKNFRCNSIISSMSGSFAGFVLGGGVTGGCALCGEDTTGCPSWEFCPCTSISFASAQDLTAAYGTWKIKYNKKVSNSLARTGRISSSFNFKKAGNAGELMNQVDTVAYRTGALGSESVEVLDAAKEDADYWYDGEGAATNQTIFGTVVSNTAVGDVAYATYKDGEVSTEADDAKPIELYSDGDVSPLVAALLSIATEVETDDDAS